MSTTFNGDRVSVTRYCGPARREGDIRTRYQIDVRSLTHGYIQLDVDHSEYVEILALLSKCMIEYIKKGEEK